MILTSTRENLSSGFENNKSKDQPAHPRSMISAFVIYVATGEIRFSSFVDEQAGSGMTWS